MSRMGYMGNTNAAGVPLPEKHVPAVRQLVNRLGTVGAARELGVGIAVIARALAGLGLRRAIVARIEERLETLSRKNTRHPGRRGAA